MNKQRRKLLAGLAIIVFLAFLAYDLLRHPGPTDMQGGFEEIGFVRNEQNKGGIVRIYAFSVADTSIADYLGCGDLLPYNDYSSMTMAYFFEPGTSADMAIRLEPPHFDTVKFHPVAVYRRGEDGIGRVKKLNRFPDL